MSSNQIQATGVFLMLWLSLCAVPASATNIIAFQPLGGDNVHKGDTIEIAVSFAFSDSTFGGGFDISLVGDLLGFKRFDFDPLLGDDPDLRQKPSDDVVGVTLTIAFGSFSELAGSKRIGTLSLLAKEDLTLGQGSPVVTARDNVTPAGPFQSLAGPLTVTYQPLTAVVPEPGTALLVASGLIGVGAIRRSRRTD